MGDEERLARVLRLLDPYTAYVIFQLDVKLMLNSGKLFILASVHPHPLSNHNLSDTIFVNWMERSFQQPRLVSKDVHQPER